MSTLYDVCRANYYRRTQYTAQLLTASILVYSKKRNYEDYKARRTADIWASREELIAYENALKLEAEIDDLTNDVRGKKGTPIEPSTISGKALVFAFETRTEPRGVGKDTKQSCHRLVQQKFETIYQTWKQLIKEPWKDRGGLERFEYGTAWRRSFPHILLILER